MTYKIYACAMAGLIGLHAIAPASANNDHHNHHNHNHQPPAMSVAGNVHNHHNHNHHDHDKHLAFTPQGIMGDHTHSKGNWMLSYRFMRMQMEGNRDGENRLDPLDITGVFPNATTTGPSTLRIVPTEMTMDMHMIGAMYAPTDRLTLMAMGHYMDKEMDHLTYQGSDADNLLGTFTTKSSGIGDTKLAGLYNLYNEGPHSIVVKAGLSLPTGSTSEKDEILNPMNAMQTIRLPYAMQLGSGTYDIEPAITYTGHSDEFGWGVQYSGIIRTSENDDDYTLGNKHEISAWGGYRFNDYVISTLRVTAETEEEIDGQDPNINGPVQTADPDNYGGERISMGIGMRLTPGGMLKGHDIGGEFIIPIHQDLNGPQLERDFSFTLGYRVAF